MRRGRLLLRVAIVSVATLVVLEAAVRGFTLARVPYPPPPPLEQATRRSGASPVSAAGAPFHVLIVGDSMIRGDGVGPGHTVGDELLQRDVHGRQVRGAQHLVQDARKHL